MYSTTVVMSAIIAVRTSMTCFWSTLMPMRLVQLKILTMEILLNATVLGECYRFSRRVCFARVPTRCLVTVTKTDRRIRPTEAIICRVLLRSRPSSCWIEKSFPLRWYVSWTKKIFRPLAWCRGLTSRPCMRTISLIVVLLESSIWVVCR